MNRRIFLCIVAVDLLFLSLTVVGIAFSAPPPPPGSTPAPGEDVKAQIEQALHQAVQAEASRVLGYLVYDTQIAQMKLTQAGDFAALWLIMADPQTGEGLPSEPGLAFASRQPGSSEWQIVLPSDGAWQEMLVNAPETAVSPELKTEYIDQYQQFMSALPSAPFTGYLLPWPQGQTRNLSQSVLHDKYTPSGTAHYAFDFYLSGQMWNLYAAKGGTVWRVKYDVETCLQPTCSDFQALGNYIVLQDTTTVPTSYQLYLHLAKESIPPALRTIGTQVLQGQLLGVVDNTGQSWGHHLHFQVHTNPSSYWGQSVDVTFGDVGINGGRPRVKTQYYDDQPYCYSSDPCSQFSSSYISGNTVKGDLTAPVGVISTPQLGATVNAATLALNGNAFDPESGFYSAQFFANYGGAWHEVGPLYTTSSFSYAWDMCQAGLPDGPVSLALRVMNREGSQNPFAGLLTFIKNYTCPPPPACTVDENHVALYEDANYKGCILYGAGDYANGSALGNLGDDDAASIKVGANIQATLWSEANYQGRGTTFLSDDPNLADNPIGAETTTSMKVQLRSALPQPPVQQIPLAEAQIPGNDVVVFAWENGGNSLEYQVEIAGPTPVTSGWQASAAFLQEGLSPGNYTWKVRARTDQGVSAWSSTRAFTILDPAPPSGTPLALPLDIPFNSSLNGWQGTGLWRLVNDSNNYRWFFQNASGDYSGTGAVSGTLTSPPINVAEAGYYLRFSTNRQTEAGLHWDQRWLQISQDNGPFIDIYQLDDDPLNSWTQSPLIDLSAYAGHQIRLRFAFSSIDAFLNSTSGWGIDDVWIHPEAPVSCSSSEEPNNMPAQATQLFTGPLLPGQALSAAGTICPAGDVDFFQFDYEGPVPMTIVADIDAQTLAPEPSTLDGVLYLLDGNDGASVLAEHDDEIYAVQRDPHLAFRLERPGSYLLKLIDWSHPGYGGPGYTYTLQVLTDFADPGIQISAPVSGSWLPGSPFDLAAEASDPDSGISKVAFSYHSSQWQNSGWIALGSDTDGSDGWSLAFNPASYPEQQGLAFYAEAFDWAGNSLGAGAWNLGIDRTAPSSSLVSLPATQTSTAIRLNWSASDNLSGVDRYDIQVNSGSGWTDAASNLPGSIHSYWFVGQPGLTYQFRMRAVDNAGNTGLYPSTAGTTTTIPLDLCAVAQPYEPDDTWSQAKPLVLGQSQARSFCKPSAGGLNDEDWMAFQVQMGKHYQFQAIPISPDAAAQLALYRLDGSNNLVPLTSANAGEFGEDTSLKWDSSTTGKVYLQVKHIHGGVAGSSVKYLIQAVEGYPIWLPWISR